MAKPIWELFPKTTKPVHCPGETITFYFEIKNPRNEYLYISGIFAKFQGETKYWHQRVETQVLPEDRNFLGSISLPLPQSEVGERKIRFGLESWEYDFEQKKWLHHGINYAKQYFEVLVMPLPIYRTFVSRSNRKEDAPIVEPIVALIKQWGFEIHTVGIDIFTQDSDKIPRQIIDEIIKSDCLVAIATPRDLSALDGFWKTLVWLHNEITMAFVMEKPLFLIADEEVKLEGLTRIQRIPKITFSIWNPGQLYRDINIAMPILREWIEEKKTKEAKLKLVKLLKEVAKAPQVFFLGYAVGKEEIEQ